MSRRLLLPARIFLRPPFLRLFAAAALLLLGATHAGPPAAAPVAAARTASVPPSKSMPPASTSGEDASPANVSSLAQAVYHGASDRLLQVRIVLQSSRSQISVGSGFIVAGDGLVATNYHVVSKVALEPKKHVIELVGTDGKTAAATLVAVDVSNDLALVRTDDMALRRPSGLPLAESGSKLQQGARIFSLGNPLDLGFAIAEGSFNGFVDQHFYRQILFSGALNPGMSGGPALDQRGRVVGVNVAKRSDGELVSFLVPVERLKDLLSTGSKPPAEFRPLITEQLIGHQARLTQALLARPWPTDQLGEFRVPVAPGVWTRCWGSTTPDEMLYVRVDSTHCSSRSAVYVNGGLRVGDLTYRHEFGRAHSGLRFLQQHSSGFQREYVSGGRRGGELAPAQCTEDDVTAGHDKRKIRLRVVLCAQALRKHPGLYNFMLLTASLDQADRGLQSRLDARGFTFSNGLAVARHFLESLQWDEPSS